MINTMTGGCNMPREMLRWLDSLDLSFSIRNPRVDLANGFLIAEVLSRYYPKQVNIYTFYNNQAKDKRINNWEQIQKEPPSLSIIRFFGYILVLLRKNFKLEKEQYLSVTNLAPDTAINLIYKLYEFLTQKKIKNDNRTILIQDDAPLYTKPTASYLAKDRQLERIVDKRQKQLKTKKTIQKHLTTIKNKKYTTGLIDWLIAKRKAQISEQLRRQQELLSKKTRAIGIQPRGEVKEIQLKCFNSSANRPGALKSKSVVDFLLDSFFIYLKKDFILKDLRKLNLQLKQKDQNVNVLEQIFKRCNEFEQERRKVTLTTLEYLIKQLNQPAEVSLVFQNIHNNFIDFKKFFSLFISALRTYSTVDSVYKLILQLIFKISTKLVETDPETTQTMFRELILKDYLKVSQQQLQKTHSICQIILSFTQPSTLNQYEMISAAKDHLSQPHQYLNYLSYFISIILVTTGQIQQNLWNQAYEYSIVGLKSASSITRTNSAKIISELVIFSEQNFFEDFSPLVNLVDDDWWEVRALALIIFSRLIISKKKGSDQSLKQQDQIPSKPNKNIDYEKIFKEFILYIIRIFYIGADEKILRIGLIQLAELLNFQKSLSSRYLQVLLSMNQSILSDVLNRNDNKLGTVSDVKNTFQYRLTGAASEWDPVSISLALEQYIRQNNISELNNMHLNILLSCLDRNNETKDGNIWLQIYDKLKPILFKSLKNQKICSLTVEILKKFFIIQSHSKKIMQNSKQDLLNLFSSVYEDGDQIPKSSILNLLKYFSEYSEDFTEYVYKVLKQFSQVEKDKYLKSNLVDFMNQLARKRRQKIFGM